MNRHKKYYMAAVMFIIVLAILIQPNLHKDQNDYSMILEEDVPLGAPPAVVKVYNSGYGVVWSQDPSVDATVYSGTINDKSTAKITILGNTTETPLLVGLTRDEAEKIVGMPLSTYNNVRISALNSPSKAYYSLNQDLLILYYDTQSPSKVLFAVKINSSLASKTRFFTSISIDPTALPDTETMTMDLLNAIRIAYGKTPLTIDERVVAISRAHSLSMVTNNYFSHDNLQGQGPKERIKAASIPYRNYGEALTAGTWTPMDALLAWMNSPAHRAIILGDFTSGGVGIATGSSTYGIYFTLNVIKN
jgi:uncharacterized protein YkwD